MTHIAACPYCQHDTADKVRFTAWGGVIGPRVLSLVKCGGCEKHYNGKSGRNVERAIRIYTVVMLFVLIGIAAGLMFATFGPSSKSSEQSKYPSLSAHFTL